MYREKKLKGKENKLFKKLDSLLYLKFLIRFIILSLLRSKNFKSYRVFGKKRRFAFHNQIVIKKTNSWKGLSNPWNANRPFKKWCERCFHWLLYPFTFFVMVQLQRIGKDKVINHHHDVPYKVLNKSYTFGDENSWNKIIHWDNLEALKSLLPQYEWKIDCIYIDPPYNTWNEWWVYNDNVNDPRIKKRLNEVVGKEWEDLSRHDKWICMMYPRLKLLQKLLSDKWAIFVSIDENELYNLKSICDEIFWSWNFVWQRCWYKSATPPNLSYKIKRNIEYLLVYEHQKNNIIYSWVQKTSSSDDPMTKPQNTFKILKFPIWSIKFKISEWKIEKWIYWTQKFPNELLNDIIVINWTNENEISFKNRFIWVQEKLEEEIQNGTIINYSKQWVLSYKKKNYSPEVPPNLINDTVWVDTTEQAWKQLEMIFWKKVFDYPKPTSLIKYLINFLCNKNSIILDSFAWSWTTAHAVLDLNKQDWWNRKFILIELWDYAENITAERVKRVIKWYWEWDKKIEWTWWGFDFYELWEPLFLDSETLNEKVGEEILRDYIRYSETKEEIQPRDPSNKYFLWTNFDTDYYFYYEKERITELNYDFLAKIKREKNHGLIIYADICSLSEDFLKKHTIIFKKIPRDISQF